MFADSLIAQLSGDANNDDVPSWVLRRALCAVAPIISDAVDHGFLTPLIHELTSIFAATRASVMLLDVPGDLSSPLVVRAHVGLPELALSNGGHRDGVAVRVLSAAQPTRIVNRADRYARFSGVAARRELGAALCVPIATSGGGVFGVLNVSRERGVVCRGFTGGDLEICDAIGMLVGDALDRLRSRAVEAELRERLRAAERLAMMGEIAAGIAHEISSPIACVHLSVASILQHLDALEPSKCGDSDVVDLRVMLEDIRTGVERTTAVVNRMKALVRLERAPRTEVRLKDVIDDALRLIRPRLRATLSVVVDDDMQRLCVSEIDLTQVLVNVVINADDACAQRNRERGGPMQITIMVEAHALNEIVIDVVDNGTGIAADRLDRIFQPLVTTKPAGTGLGLSLSRRLIEEQGGRLLVSSIVDVGTTLRIVLPI